MFSKYTADILNYINTKRELEKLQSQNIINEHQILQAKEDLKSFRNSIAEVRQQYGDIENWGLSTTLAQTPIVKSLKNKGTKGLIASDEELRELRRMFNIYLPGFSEAIKSCGYQLSTKDVSICMFIKLNFSPYEIHSLMNMSNSALSNLRKRLLMRMFNIDGSSMLFDEKIRELNFDESN